MKTFSFVIPTYNHYPLLHTTLYDIYQKCSRPDEVIVVDDYSDDETYHAGLKWWKENGMLPIRHVRTKENYGFLKASNVGLKKAKGDIVCLMSNDVRLHGDILTQISRILSAENGGTLVGGRMIDWDSGWNTFNGRTYKYLEGWLLATTNDAWRELGYFDTQFAPSDMEDVDLSATAFALGYDLIALPQDLTHHMGGQSIGFNPEREAITIQNKEKFRLKWTTTNSNNL